MWIYLIERNAAIHHRTGFPRYNIFSSCSGYLLFNTRANYTKIKRLNSGKITSLPNSENVINLHASFQSSQKINRMVITRLICIQSKSSRFLSPVSTVSARNAWWHGVLFGTHAQKKRKKETPPFLESRSAKANSTNESFYTNKSCDEHAV